MLEKEELDLMVTHSFFFQQVVTECLLFAKPVVVTNLAAVYVIVNKIFLVPCFYGLYILVGEPDVKK